MKAPVLEIASAAALERRLSRTLRDLAAIGDKRAGSAAGAASATYIQDRMNAAGVGNVRLETFRFASFVLRGSGFRAGGRDLAHEVLAYSGCGSAAAPLVHVGTGEPADYDGLDLSGRIALVERNVTFHRSAQYREAVARGAVGLVHISHAPENLIQIGTVSDPEDGLGPIPALSVGERDGKDLIVAARAGGLTVEIRIDAALQPATGRNVVGRLAGEGPPLLIGAHHNTWHVGSTDNGSGIAVLLELAERLAHEPRRRGAVLVAYDAEELGLFGGYDFLRKHVVEAGERFAAFVVLPLKPGCFGVARIAGTPVVPVAIAWEGESLSWTGDASFVPHYLQVAARERTRVRIQWGDPLEGSRTATDRELASLAHEFLARAVLEARDAAATRA